MTMTLNDRTDAVNFSNAANSETSPTFRLLGGRYSLTIFSSGTASVDLQVLTPSGNYINCGSSPTVDSDVFDLRVGTYRLVFGSAAGTADGVLSKVPKV